jgi:hypothetical protein
MPKGRACTTGLIWLRTGTVEGSCDHGNEPPPPDSSRTQTAPPKFPNQRAPHVGERLHRTHGTSHSLLNFPIYFSPPPQNVVSANYYASRRLHSFSHQSPTIVTAVSRLSSLVAGALSAQNWILHSGRFPFPEAAHKPGEGRGLHSLTA